MAEIPSSTKYDRQDTANGSTNRREFRSDGESTLQVPWELDESNRSDSLIELVVEFGKKRPKTLLAGAILLGLGLVVAGALEDDDDDDDEQA